MTILITLTTVGIDCSTFDIYSNVDGFLSAFETAVPKASLSAGFSSANVPNGTTVIRVKAKGLCSNYIDLQLINATSYSISDRGYNDLVTACGALANDIVYSRNAPYLYIGDRVYGDRACTSPLNGGDLWYRVDASPHETDVTVIKISSSGVIIDRGYCSRGTDPSPTTTTTTTSTPINNTWLIINQDCGGSATLNSVSVNDVSMSSFSPLTSTLSVSRTNPNGVNYGSSDNKIMVSVSNIPSGTRTARILVSINNGSREYYTDFTTSPFPTVNNVLINSGDSVKVILQCIPL